ncbi:efflux transporter periplasmic adaptor subunit [Pseudoroseomonas deserti]|uniref:Efflux transporter periplasmic adaptor subunit n=1 Tax=Teichococcus deserti TaxID=1817963 RepID=A0A1V2HAC9_9PROT|nr:efflux RND transporter periplasmic adaptor subunit [Pseudoroseomonas deserti]ONG58895.1 efflux transporter periplasmic adaptor subunit [Pseudoroseomonas deserti]
MTLPSQAFLARRGLVPLGGLLLGALALAGCKEEAKAQGQAAAAPPPPVTVVRLAPEAVSLETLLPGRTTAFQTAEIRPQVGGVIREKLYREGETVAAGQTLFQIDPAPYRAALASAQATLARAEATLSAARVTANRYRPLVAQNAVSRLDYDNAVAAQRQAEADVAAGKASVETAQINLDYTRVSSPIAGRTSRSSLTVGALVTADQTGALLTVTQLDPIYVDVTQPSATLLRLRRELAAGRIRSSGDAAAEVHLVLEDGTAYPNAGKLQFSEATVDAETGSVTLRAQFPNPDGVLMPGMFVRQRLEEGIAPDALLVPQQAVTRNYKGEATAMVVQADGTVAGRVLRTERAIGNKWLVSGGLQAGDRVVVEGLQRIAPGAKPQVTEVSAAEFDARTRQQAGS